MIKNNLKSKVKELNSEYNQNKPYPHLVFDDLLDESVMQLAARESKFYTEDHIRRPNNVSEMERVSHNDQTKKHSVDRTSALPAVLASVIEYLNGDEFIGFIRNLTNMHSLIPDPTLAGGGLHFTEAGGKLGIHHDFNYLDETMVFGNENVKNLIRSVGGTLYRKCNLILFLNEDWQDEWGGGLELWNPDLTSRAHLIMPKLNRAVLFNIENAPHGHPHPLMCPSNECRRTIALYYYDRVPVTNRLYNRAHWKYGQELL